MAETKVIKDGKVLPEIGETVQVNFINGEKARYMVIKIPRTVDGHRFALLPVDGILAGRVIGKLCFHTITELVETVDEAQFSTDWSIINDNSKLN